MIVGAFEAAFFAETTIRLGAGESLFLYTDGVPEARRDGELFGEERLLAALAAPVATPELIDQVLDLVLDFQRHLPRDDIALLAIRVPD